MSDMPIAVELVAHLAGQRMLRRHVKPAQFSSHDFHLASLPTFAGNKNQGS